LENIFSVYLLESVSKTLGNQIVFAPIIEMLKFLEETGIEIEEKRIKRSMKFVLGSVLIGNLGLTDILGFVKGFTANQPCRISKMSLRKSIRENLDLLRAKE
jgi:hypothetical protein